MPRHTVNPYQRRDGASCSVSCVQSETSSTKTTTMSTDSENLEATRQESQSQTILLFALFLVTTIGGCMQGCREVEIYHEIEELRKDIQK